MKLEEFFAIKTFGRRDVVAVFDEARDAVLAGKSGNVPPPWAELLEPISLQEMRDALQESALKLVRQSVVAMLRK